MANGNDAELESMMQGVKLSGDGDNDHEAAAANIREQLAVLNKKLMFHTHHLEVQKKKEKSKKQVESLFLEEPEDVDDADEGDDEGEDSDSEEDRGPVWSPPKLPTPCNPLCVISNEELATLIAETVEVDSSDSENEWDAVKDADSDFDDEETGSDDEGEDEGDEGDESEDAADWQDAFPFEENLFLLSEHYHIIKRLATNDDAIVYQALQRDTNIPVAIKISIGDKGVFQPKAVNLVSAVQGHPDVVKLICWHSLPSTTCHALVLGLVPNDSIEEYVFGYNERIRNYVRDMIKAVDHCHQNGVLFRDVKPDNIMWSHDRQQAVLIDFDVASFYRKQGHRAVVGSDGYMAPEIVAISKAKQAWKERTIEERKQAKEAKVKKIMEQKRRANKKKSPSKVEESSEEEEDFTRPTLKDLGCEPYGHPVDVYSCGVVFGQLLFEVSDDFVLDYVDDHDDTLHDYFMALVAKEEEYEVAFDLLARMTDKNQHTRITFADALKHPYFTGKAEQCEDILAGREQLLGNIRATIEADAAAKKAEEEARLAAEAKAAEQKRVAQIRMSGGGLMCFGCTKLQPKGQFSKNQLKKKGPRANTRRCFECTSRMD